ncbi:uridylate kinase [Natronomonas pharaonis DSM 2160]|uniref:Uridylate kinase n=1 Tax=Natronomonas pharaonis (strain ATCC 35678 / DSM 2160 / CIP 103997 / JCM 8858 / NBRC 14720 / NCIMB 2260 / Gabara) TaxID=348780 RepID=PYRH_NATPD|nr:UMP kinase [Natronomonas pharaonis]Q3IRL6.1 RecName: Full=Uridylate kinase; Short=UK; AltName: Full=Uridine monophosphate kinase; Short=UMP kinase; Short=UMPK [Natronomonas pharaonis DSM 2160]CAI49227.1 uridylate kinase [Natronomonas pharaonis DSM 2160]
MRIIVSIGGSVLAPDLEAGRVEAHADAIDSLVADGHEVAAVVGGGDVARQYIDSARDLGATEYDLDALGIDVTRLNARLLVTALNSSAIPEPAESHEDARASMRRGEVAVMGGTVPGHTTDAVAAMLAEMVEADLLIYATSVPGVFSADPNEDPSAERFDRLEASKLVDVISSIETTAGSNAPVDLLAAKVIERSGLRAIVLDGTAPERIADAVDGDPVGTEVLPNE